MSGQKRKGQRRSLTPEEMRDHAKQSLETIRSLCEIYDKGQTYIAFTIASEIDRFFTIDHNVRLRSALKFSTVDVEQHPDNLVPHLKLIVAKLNGADPPDLPWLECAPRFNAAPSLCPTRAVDFTTWWSRDVIFRASAARPGSPPGFIPFRAEDQVPFNKRATYTRGTFIKVMRNTLGAHLDPATPDQLDKLLRSQSLGIDFSCTVQGRTLSTMDGSLPTKIGPAAAMVRQIAEETLRAFEA